MRLFASQRAAFFGLLPATLLPVALLAAVLTAAACGSPDDGGPAQATPADIVDTAADVGASDTGPDDTGSALDSGSVAGPDAQVDVSGVVPGWSHQCQKTADCAPFEDGNACNGTLFCNLSTAPHRCTLKPSTLVTCSAAKDHACASNTCDPATGKCAMKPTPKDTPCMDGDPCTATSACDGQGSCVPDTKASLCACKKSADCDAVAAANLCLGSWYCDLSVFPWTCRLNPNTAVKCSAKNDTACAGNVCDPKTGACAMKDAVDGTPCDDGDKVTLGDICKSGTCQSGVKAACNTNSDCDIQEDGDVCNGTLYCDKTDGACKVNPVTVIVCSVAKDTACIKNSCDPDSGACHLKPLKNGTGCNDGDKCTKNEVCLQGKCAAGIDLCPCTDNKSCAAHEDGNACNGTLFCNKKTKKCELNPASVVVCPSGQDTACTKNACVTKTGQCVMTVAEHGTLLACPQAIGPPKPDCRWEVKLPGEASVAHACDDGDKCTFTSTCTKGVCSGQNTLCTCADNADCAKQEDGNACNGTLFCNPKTKLCEVNKATVVHCPKSQAGGCLHQVCQPASGKCAQQPVATGTPCDDGEPCTKAEYCALGQCKGGLKACECLGNADCVGKDDGDACNGVYFCDKSGDKPACKFAPDSAVVCPPGPGPCLVNKCLKTTGKCALKKELDGTKCDDGDPCSTGDQCAKGVCKASGDACSCSKDSDCADDGNKCNGTMFCDKATNKPRCKLDHSTKVTCPSGADTTCLVNACAPLSGACSMTSVESAVQHCDVAGGSACRWAQQPKSATPRKVSCDDGDACTSGDRCGGGACKSGTFTCSCAKDADCATKTDGDKCKGGWHCDKSAVATGGKPQCKPNPANFKVCPSFADTPCVKNACAPATGKCLKAPVANGTTCDDGEPCRINTVCLQGECKAGVQVCECLSHAECEAKKGDGNLCNGTFYCDKSAVKSGGKPACKLHPATVVTCAQDTGTPCAKKVCNPATGICQATPANNGATCDDGDACTAGDRCAVGLCAGATKTACDDGDNCTKDVCDKATGCAHTKVNCDDGNSCTQEQCSQLTGTCFKDVGGTQGKLCNADGTPCTQGDACDKGTCKAGVPVACKAPADSCATSKCIGVSATSFKCVTLAKPDGQSCDDATSCVQGSVCKAGTCKPGTVQRLWTRRFEPGKGVFKSLATLYFTAGVALDEGGVVVAGRRKSGSFIARLDNAAAASGVRPVLTDSAKSALTTVSAMARVGKQVIAVGEQLAHSSGSSSRMWLGRFSADGGKTLSSELVGVAQSGARQSLGSAASRPGRGMLAGGVVTPAKQPYQAAVVYLGDGGKVAWIRQFTIASNVATATGAVAIGSNGALLAAGHSAASNGNWVRIYTTSGALVSEHKIAHPKPWTHSYITAVAARDEGGYAALRYRYVHGTDTSEAHLVALGADGKPAAEVLIGKGFAGYQLVPLAGGRWAVGGWVHKAKTQTWQVRGVDAVGKALWSHQVVGQFAATHDMFRRADGTIVTVGGNRLNATTHEAIATRLTPFGDANCHIAGVCFGKTWSTCDDGKPCTGDGCVGSTGCTHSVKAAEGSLCPVNAKGCITTARCVAGSCKPQPDGKLFSAGHSPSALAKTSARKIFADPTHGYGIYGLNAKGTMVATFNASGALKTMLPEASPGPTDKVAKLPAQLLYSGGVWTYVDQYTTGTPAVAAVRYGALDAKGQPATARGMGSVRGKSYKWYPVSFPVGLVELKAGEVVAAIGYVGLGYDAHYKIGRIYPKAGTTSSTTTFRVYAKYGGGTGQIPVVGKDGLIRILTTGAVVNGHSYSRLVRVDAGLTSARVFGRGGSNYPLAAAAVLDNGWIATAGTTTTYSGSKLAHVTAITASGATIQEHNPDGKAHSVIAGLAPHGSGYVVARNRPIGADLVIALSAHDAASGARQWQRNIAIKGRDLSIHGAALTALPGGGLVLFGSNSVPSKPQWMLWRLDAFGHTNCVSSGTCFETKASACDDKNPCTIDFCDSASGCKHSTLKDGSGCGSKKTCKVGVCKP